MGKEEQNAAQGTPSFLQPAVLGLAWVSLVAAFSHVDLLADLMHGNLSVESEFSWDNYVCRGSLFLFSSTLVATIVVDHMLMGILKKCETVINCLAILLPFAVVMSSLVAYMILHTSKGSALDVTFASNLQLALLMVAFIYALGIKALQFHYMGSI